MNLNPIGGIVEAVGSVIDDVWTSDEEKLKLALQEREIVSKETIAVQEVNKAEASHPSTFVAGWRPFIGWIGGISMAYQFVAYPFLMWGIAIWAPHVTPPPEISADALWTIVTGMLGIAGMRSWDKRAGKDTKKMK